MHFVVVLNLTRFARDNHDHFALRSHLQSLGISLRSATEPTNVTLRQLEELDVDGILARAGPARRVPADRDAKWVVHRCNQ